MHRLLRIWPEHRPRYILGDRSYDTVRVHKWLKRHHIKDAVAWNMSHGGMHRPKHFPKIIYKKRNAIERCVGKLKEQRAIATRYDKLAKSFAGELWLEFIRQYLAALEKIKLVNTA